MLSAYVSCVPRGSHTATYTPQSGSVQRGEMNADKRKKPGSFFDFSNPLHSRNSLWRISFIRSTIRVHGEPSKRAFTRVRVAAFV